LQDFPGIRAFKSGSRKLPRFVSHIHIVQAVLYVGLLQYQENAIWPSSLSPPEVCPLDAFWSEAKTFAQAVCNKDDGDKEIRAFSHHIRSAPLIFNALRFHV
jgi:hypothetical protein